MLLYSKKYLRPDFLCIVTALFVFLLCFTTKSHSQEILLREPYIQNITSRSAEILWGSTEARKYLLRLSQIDARNNQRKVFTESKPALDHIIKIRRLLPGTRYAYQVINPSGKIIFSSKFKTAGRYADTSKVKIAVLGDSGFGVAVQSVLAAGIKKYKPDIILHTGDIVYPDGSLDRYKKNFFDPYKSLIRSIPFYPAIGNHDAINPTGFNKVFSTPYAASNSPINRYYSFNYGLAHITVIDSNSSFNPGSDQYNWIKEDLNRASTDKKLKKLKRIVLFHHPPYSAGRHGDNVNVQLNLVPLLEGYKVSLVLNGHDHAYERILSNSSPAQGPLYIVTGGGGATLYKNSNPEHPKVAIFEAQYHYLQLNIRKKSILGKAVNDQGKIIDEWRI